MSSENQKSWIKRNLGLYALLAISLLGILIGLLPLVEQFDRGNLIIHVDNQSATLWRIDFVSQPDGHPISTYEAKPRERWVASQSKVFESNDEAMQFPDDIVMICTQPESEIVLEIDGSELLDGMNGRKISIEIDASGPRVKSSR